jgi:DNA-binding transcriptional LysR family regulator
MHDEVLELYRRAGIEPRIHHMKVGHCNEARLALAAAGKGIYVGAGIVINREFYGNVVTMVSLDEPGATIEVLMAWRKNEQSATALTLLDSARKVFRKAN